MDNKNDDKEKNKLHTFVDNKNNTNKQNESSFIKDNNFVSLDEPSMQEINSKRRPFNYLVLTLLGIILILGIVLFTVI